VNGCALPGELASAVEAALEDWNAHDKVRRLWERDASLWTGSDEGRWLDWLGAVEGQQSQLGRLRSLAEEIKGADFTHALLLGMGGSSLCPDVLKATFGRLDGFPELHVLDSTDPAQVQAFEERVDLPTRSSSSPASRGRRSSRTS